MGLVRLLMVLLSLLSVNQFEALVCAAPTCEASLNIPSAEDVKEFVAKNPPPQKPDPYVAKGLFQGDMTGFRVKDINTSTEEIITPERITADAIRWPNKLIPYEFYEKIDDKMKQFAMLAMDDLHNKSCVRFIPRSYEDDYIKISPGTSQTEVSAVLIPRCGADVVRFENKKKLVRLARTFPVEQCHIL